MEQLDVIFDNDVAEKALKGISKTPIYKAHKFLALTGMRSGEVRALNWGQISNDNHEVLITQSSHTLQTTDSK